MLTKKETMSLLQNKLYHNIPTENISINSICVRLLTYTHISCVKCPYNNVKVDKVYSGGWPCKYSMYSDYIKYTKLNAWKKLINDN